ncbi:MAG TPA: protein kinase, partial [Myxococcota bacterium]|nr:protein kinase [Myxococcota bacterium]
GKETYITHLQRRAPEPSPVKLKALNTMADGYYYVKHSRGAGAFGTFFVGYSKQTARPVGIKQMRLPRPANLPKKRSIDTLPNAQTLDQVRQEVQMMLVAGSAYRPICAGVNPRKTKAYIVQELLFGDGEDLRRELLLSSPRIAPNLFGRYLLGELARGLEAIHAKGMIHRDIKLSNVLFDRDSGCMAYADFGLAVLSRSTPNTAGTPAFMAFEQHDPRTKHQPITAKADVQSLALAVVYALAGEAVFMVTREDWRRRVVEQTNLEAFRAFWREWRHGETPAPRFAGSAAFVHFESILGELQRIDRELAQLLMLMLDPDPSSRPSAADVAHHRATRLTERKHRDIKNALNRLPQFKEDYDYYLDMAVKAVTRLIHRGLIDRLSTGLEQTPSLRSARPGPA